MPHRVRGTHLRACSRLKAPWAVERAREFNRVVGIDGVILQVDADAKSDAALSAAYTIGKPLRFVGTRQGYDDQEFFNADWIVERLFGGEKEAEVEA